MKKIYTLLASTFILNSFAQSVPSSTLVNGTFGSGSTVFATDVDKTNAYYYKPFPFTLKKIASNNTESVFLSNSDYCLLPGIAIKGSKAIISTPSLFGGPTKVYLFNGAAKDSITMPTNTQSCFKNHPVNTAFGYFNDSSRIYKTNYTAAGTNTIVPQRSNTIIYSIMEKNDKLLVYEAIKNTSGTNYDRKYLYFYDGNSYSKLDSVNSGSSIGAFFQIFKNPTNGDLYAIKQTGNDTIQSKIWKFTGTGIPTVFNTSRKFVQVTTMLNDKIIGLVPNATYARLVSVDVNTTALTYIVTGNFLNTYQYYGYWFSNGNVAYFLHNGPFNRVPCVTNGLTADTITTKTAVGSSTIWKGDFCGDDFWTEDGVDRTVIFSPNKTYKYVSVNNNPLNKIYKDPIFADNHMYFKSENLTTSVYALYKAACGGPVGINEFSTNQTQFSIYPNPANEILNVKLEMLNESTPLIITNILGEVVLTQVITSNNFSLTTNNLKSGIYFLQVGNSKAVKFIKE
jgi:hypothetical protein